MIQIDRFLNVAGCTVYVCDDKGMPSPFPVAIDANVTLPDVTFSTTTVSMMGSQDVPVQCAIENMTASFTLGDNSSTAAIRKKGQITVLVRFAQMVSRAGTGLSELVGFTARLTGFVSGKGGVSIASGETAQSDLSLSVLKYRLTLDDGEELIDIDRPAGRIVILGEDYMSDLHALL